MKSRTKKPERSSLSAMDPKERELQKNPEIPDKLFGLAFQYRDTRLWKRLSDTEVFAVRFSTGEIGCCCVLGYKGNYISLVVYVGEKAVRSYLRVIQMSPAASEADRLTVMHQLDCVQCGFYNKKDLAEEIIVPVNRYAKSHGMNLKGAYSYPNFIASKPLYMPWFITDSGDFIYLQEALSAALEVADKLEKHSKNQLGFNSSLSAVPLLCPNEKGYTWETYQMPDIAEEDHPSPELQDANLIRQISELPRKGRWECELVILPTPVTSSTTGIPYYPTLLIAVDTENHTMIPADPIEDYFHKAQQIVLKIADAILAAGTAPELIAVPDKRTASLLSHFCEACGISYIITDSFTMLDDVRKEMLGHLKSTSGEAMADKIAELLMSLSDAELLAMPPELLQNVTRLLARNALPPELAKRIRRLFSL